MIVAALILVAIPFAILLLEVIFKGSLTLRDQSVANTINRYNIREDDGTEISRVVTQFGSTVVLSIVVLGGIVYLGVIHRRRRQALFLLTTAVLGLALNNAIKVVVGRARPHFDQAGATAFGSSFPSGHAMNSTVVYGSMFILIWPRLRTFRTRVAASVALVSVILAIAASRVVLTVHFVSDVVAGIVLGTAFVLASAASFAAWRDDGGHLPTKIEEAPAIADDDVADAPPTPRAALSECIQHAPLEVRPDQLERDRCAFDDSAF